MDDNLDGTVQDAAISRWFGAYGAWVVANRWLMAGLLTLICAGAVWLSTGVKVDNSLQSFFDESDVAYTAYTGYQKDFGPDEVSYLMYSVPGSEHGVFDMAAMRKVDRLTKALESEVPFVDEVTSLTNVEFITATGDDITIDEIGRDWPDSQQALTVRRDAMRNKPIYLGALIDRSGRHGAIVIEMSRTSTDPLDRVRADPEGGDGLENIYPQVSSHKIEEIIARPEYSELEFSHTGDVPFNTVYNEVISAETGEFALLSIAIAAILAMLCFRMRFAGLIGPVLVVVLSLIFTLAFMAVAGLKLGLLFLLVPTLVIAVGVAQAVHILTEFQQTAREGLGRSETVRRTLAHVGWPCFLTAITTAAGFFSMATSKLKGLADSSLYMAASELFTFLLTITVFVTVLAFWPMPKSQVAAPVSGPADPLPPSRFDRMLASLAELVVTRPRRIVAVWGLVFLVTAAGTAQLHVGFNFLDDFKDHVRFKQDTLRVEKQMGGLLNVVYLFDTGKPDGVKDAELLAAIDRIQAFADKQDVVAKTFSLGDLVKDINQSFHGDDRTYNRIPADDQLISQYLLLYEMSGGRDLADYVDGDYGSTVLELRVKNEDSDKLKALVADMDAFIAKQELPGATVVKPTGVGLLWIKVTQYIADSQIPGYLLAFTSIAAILMLAFRSVKVGLLAMTPNLVPVVVVLGYMGWAGIHLDWLRLLLATVGISLAVDDTIHFVSRLRLEFARCGNYVLSIRRAMTETGRALIFTTLILVASFSVFMISELASLSSFGILLTIIITVALLADVLLLPALIMLLKPFGPERTSEQA